MAKLEALREGARAGSIVAEVKQSVKALPFMLTKGRQRRLDKYGWIQVTFGSEFTTSSYVIGNTPADARKGRTYEAAEDRVYKCSHTGLFWRSTGSFD